MKKQNITKLLVLSLAALVFLPACGGNSSSSSSSQQQSTTSSQQQSTTSSSSSSSQQQASGWGTETAPLTVAQAIAKMSSFASGDWSTEEGYVSGIVIDKYYNSKYSSYSLTIVDDLNSSSSTIFKIYSAELISGVEEPNVGDTALGKGYFTKYNDTTYEVAYSADPAHTAYVAGITHNTYSVSVVAGENVTVSSIPTSAQSGDTISFTVTPSAGYIVSSVKVGGNTIVGASGNYSFIVGINNKVEVEVMEETAVGSSVVFELGTDDASKNKADEANQDGSDAGTSYTESVGGYTLSLTNMSRVYKNSYDAQGHACLKLGTGDYVGSFEFTVPSDITSVVINVTGYKAKKSKVTVNGTEYTLTKSSSNGEYDAITIDTTTTKTITFATVAGATRCKITSIEFVK